MPILGKQNGFTVLEILVAIIMLVIALLGMASVTVMVIKGNSYSKYTTTAATLANDKLEDLKHQAFDAGDLTEGEHQDADNPLQALYTRKWQVGAARDVTGAKVGMKTISVMVDWSWEGRQRNVTIRTIMANPNYY